MSVYLPAYRSKEHRESHSELLENVQILVNTHLTASDSDRDMLCIKLRLSFEII